MAWVKWDSILAPLDMGALNVGSLKAFNDALLLKWRWRYLMKPDDLWVTIIKAIHGNLFKNATGQSTSPWSAIVSFCNRSMETSLLLRDVFRKQNDFVADKCIDGNWVWTWLRDNIGARNAQLLDDLRELINHCHLNNRDDSWLYTLASDGLFTVKSAREYIDRKLLPSSHNLTAKGIDITSIVCPICLNGTEVTDHLFFSCSVAKDFWAKVRLWTFCWCIAGDLIFHNGCQGFDSRMLQNFLLWLPAISWALEVSDAYAFEPHLRGYYH
ncbi:uncharacterized protein [Rutidosis leptorrhynchoides]|uniref:uncharacterized protein n=1 Tax=Rutidosis leptorrhynchoides TaxID=125765 RepID=UPI003A9988F3